MSAGRITSPSSVEYDIKRGPDKSRLIDSWKYRYDEHVRIDTIFQLDGPENINVQISKLEYGDTPDIIEFTGFVPRSGSIAQGHYDLLTREGTVELFM